MSSSVSASRVTPPLGVAPIRAKLLSPPQYPKDLAFRGIGGSVLAVALAIVSWQADRAGGFDALLHEQEGGAVVVRGLARRSHGPQACDHRPHALEELAHDARQLGAAVTVCAHVRGQVEVVDCGEERGRRARADHAAGGRE